MMDVPSANILPMDNEEEALTPSTKWLKMDVGELRKAMNKFQTSGHKFKSSKEMVIFHYVLLNLMAKDDPKIHERLEKPERSKIPGKCYTPLVGCLKKLYEDINIIDYEDHQVLLQSFWIRTVLKPKSDYWSNSLERLSYIELPFLEYAVVVLDQEVENSYMEDFFTKIGKDILDVLKDKVKHHNIDETKLSAILALCKSLASSKITQNTKDGFTIEQITLLRKIFQDNLVFKRPSIELVLADAKRKKLEESQLANSKP